MPEVIVNLEAALQMARLQLQSRLSREDFWRALVKLAANDPILRTSLECGDTTIGVPDATASKPNFTISNSQSPISNLQ